MPDHVRKQLRDAVAQRLTGLATTGANVFPHRAYPLEKTSLPALRIYTSGENVEVIDIHFPNGQERIVSLNVEGIDFASEPGLDDRLDAIALEVESALSAPMTVASRSVHLVYTGSNVDVDEAAKPHGSITLNYQAKLFTSSNAPDVLQN